MMKKTALLFLMVLVVAWSVSPACAVEVFNGDGENGLSSYGYYYAMTGGKFPTGNTPNGDNGSGGTFRYVTDDADWGYTIDVWHKDDWFPTNASLALTLKNQGAIVYDNNGIEDSTYGTYYDGTGVAKSADVPGLYRGYCMSNNWDWIYAGYFKLAESTTFDTIIGYYDENSGFDSSTPELRFDMNIWSAYQDDPTGHPNSWMPTDTGSFTGDVFSAKSATGSFAWSDSGVDRIFGDDYGNAHDDILRLAFTLDTPMTLPAGVYFFSHDAEVPEPGTLVLLITAGLGALAYVWRRRRG